MVCPYKEMFNCPFVDTTDMSKTINCRECEFYWVNRENEVANNNSIYINYELLRHTN